MSKHRVLHTNFLHGWGGQSNRILVECEGLSRLGWDVLVSAPGDSQLLARARAKGLSTHDKINYVGGLKRGSLKDLLAMRQLLLDFQPEIVHLHGGKDSWLLAEALLMRLPFPRPIIIRTKHNVFPIKDHLLNRWQYGKFFDSIVCLSTAIMDQLRAKPYVDSGKLVQIPSAIEPARFQVSSGTKARIRHEFGFEDHHLVIGMTGRLRPEKGHDILLRAIPKIMLEFPSARFLLLGAGSMHSELADQLAATGHAQNVVMAGFRDDVVDCLAAIDVYVQPSRSEGLGTSIIEASAAGLPIVASRTGGIPDVLVHEQTGLLVEPESDSELAEGVLRLLKDGHLRTKFGEAARQRVVNHFSVTQLVANTDALYRRLMSLDAR